MAVHPDVRLDPATVEDVDAVARLHLEQLSESFLSIVGERFLRVLYRRMARNEGSTLLVAQLHGEIVGFIAGTRDTGRFYRDFLRHDAVRACATAAPALVRHPWTTVETLRYGRGSGSAADLPPAELLSLAVAPAARRNGIAGALIGALQQDFSAQGVSAIKVTVAADNTTAITAYRRCGFRTATRVEVHRGRSSEVLVWR